MSVISGKLGAIDGIASLRDWSVITTNDVQAHVDSACNGAESTVKGNDDWTGTANAYGDSPTDGFLPGQGFAFTGSVDGSVGITGNVIVDQLEITIPIEDGGLISYRMSFSGNGAYVIGAAVASDATDPSAPTAVGRVLHLNTSIASPSYAAISGVRSVTITLSSDNKAHNDSDTAGATERTAGNISGTISYDIYEGTVASLPTVGDHVSFRAYVTATTYWVFQWGEITEISGIGANPETADLVNASISAKFSGYADNAGTPVVGTIIEPDTTVFWP